MGKYPKDRQLQSVPRSLLIVLYLKRPRVDLRFRCAVYGRFRYRDLKEAAPGDLWGLYVDEPVLIVREAAVAVGALRF
jgi:hypothetical protein